MEKVHLILWGIVFIVTVIAELCTLQLVSIWFAAGALAAFIYAFFMPFEWQIIIFLAVSILMLLFTRPILKKLSAKNRHHTNAELDIGKSAIVIEEINSVMGTGRVTLNGVDWIAVSLDSTIIPKGAAVIVEEIDGAKFIVTTEKALEEHQTTN